MSVQVKTPTHNTSFEANVSGTSQPVSSADSSKKRRPADREHPSIVKKRRYSASHKFGRAYANNFKLYKGGTITDPLNLSSLENRTGPSPAPSPNAYLEKLAAPRPPPKISNLADPLNLTIDVDTGEVIGPLSPTGPIRYKRKRLSKRTKQKLEIDFDSDHEDNLPTDLTADTSEDVLRRLTDPLNLGAIPVSTSTLAAASSMNEPTLVSTIDSNQKKPDVTGPGGSKDSTSHIISPDRRHKSKSTESSSHLHTKSHVLSRQKSTHAHKHKSTIKPVGHDTTTSKLNSSSSRKGNLFIHGNYDRYYGYRSIEKMEVDPRIQALKPAWFHNKAVLDIGCNIGHVTLTIARDLFPSKVVGVDIDSKLISIARKNTRYYKDKHVEKAFPASCPSSYGPISIPDDSLQEMSGSSMQDAESKVSSNASFPNNVTFMHSNYCLESDVLLDMVKAEFDVILALSVTKWMHLNNGDDGLKRCFKRMFLQLTPGGVLILEPQMWPSYKKRKGLTPAIRKRFDEIAFRPDQFIEYLLSPEVGFTTCERLNVHEHQAKGFRRPLLVFRKCER